jgi:serine/threonine protein phosphatase PrpC
MRFGVTAVSHTGLVREHNEDAFMVGGLVSPGPAAVEAPITLSVPGRPLVCAVIDGLGGHEGGEVASELVAAWLAGWASEAATDDGSPPDEDDLVAVVHALNDHLHREMLVRPELAGMGCTFVGAIVLGDEAIWCNVGDSRAYLFGPDGIEQISEDDSPAGPQGGSRTSLVLQTLGGLVDPEPVDPHVGRVELGPGRRLLLCSDGLTDVVDDARLAATLDGAVADEDPAAGDLAAVEDLLAASLEAGGPDNCTMMLIRADG